MHHVVVAATTARDGWDWLVVVLTIVVAVAAVTALLGFVSWWLEHRHRPELLLGWDIQCGNEDHLRPWPPDETPVLHRGEVMTIRVGIRNVGDAFADPVLTNFLVAEVLTLTNARKPDEKPEPSENNTAGVRPGHRITFLAKADTIALDDAAIRVYEVRISETATDLPHKVRLVLVASCSRLNSTGRRRLPSLVPLPIEHAAPVGTPWPTPYKTRRWPRIVRAEPAGRVECVPGSRRDVRDIELHATGRP